MSSASTFEMRRDQTIVATDLTVSRRRMSRLKEAMASGEEIRITMRPPHEEILAGRLRAIYFVEDSGLTTLTIDRLDPPFSFAAEA